MVAGHPTILAACDKVPSRPISKVVSTCKNSQRPSARLYPQTNEPFWFSSPVWPGLACGHIKLHQRLGPPHKCQVMSKGNTLSTLYYIMWHIHQSVYCERGGGYFSHSLESQLMSKTIESDAWSCFMVVCYKQCSNNVRAITHRNTVYLEIIVTGKYSESMPYNN